MTRTDWGTGGIYVIGVGIGISNIRRLLYLAFDGEMI